MTRHRAPGPYPPQGFAGNDFVPIKKEPQEDGKTARPDTKRAAAPGGSSGLKRGGALGDRRGGAASAAPRVLVPHPDSIGDGDVGQFSPMDDGTPEQNDKEGDSKANPLGAGAAASAASVTPETVAATPTVSSAASPGESERIKEQRRVAEMRRKAAAARTKVEDSFEIDTQSDVASLFAPPMKKERCEETVSGVDYWLLLFFVFF